METRRIVDELIVVMAAAQEPMSIALTWLLERLSREFGLDQRWLEASPSDRFREAVINETLRLHPPALASLRRLTAETTVSGDRLPAGTNVMISIPLLHREPVLFAEPNRFEPSRFLNGAAPTSFVPFGDGVRICPGEALARAELRLVPEVVLRRLRLRFLGSFERPVQRATVAVPHRSGLAVARHR